MVLTAGQISTFFTDSNHMHIPVATVAQLAHEGIDMPSDLEDFEKDSLKQVADNLRNPGGRVNNPDANAPRGSTIAKPPFVFGAKSQKRLLAACDIVRFYNTIGRDITPSSIRYNPVIRNFEQQWKALVNKKDDDPPETPKASKSLPIIKWTEAFTEYLSRKIGSRNIPLAYIIREDVVPPATVPPLATDKPHSMEHGSVEGDLVAMASHTHPLYRDDNAEVYYDLETALRATSYLASIKPYQRAKNGRDAFFSIKQQYAGEDKWQSELRKQEEIVHTRIWKGQGQFTLDRFVAQHRNAFVTMQECAQHIPYQLPNPHTRVTHLLDNIQCDYPALQASMALIRNDKGPTGKMNDFEQTASFIIPHDPVVQRRQKLNKRTSAEISGIEDEGEDKINISSTSMKPSNGKTGVELRFYKHNEYQQLTAEQKSELHEWRASSQKKRSDPKKPMDGDIASAVAKELVRQQLAAENTEKQKVKFEDEFQSYVMSIVAKGMPTGTHSKGNKNDSNHDDKQSVSIHSILKRVGKN